MITSYDNSTLTTDLQTRIQEISAKGALLCERLNHLGTTLQDEELRSEIADLAAQMIVLTQLQEGETSPLLKILDGNGKKASRKNLATKAIELLDATKTNINGSNRH